MGTEADARHDAKPFAVQDAHVQHPPIPEEPDPHSACYVDRDAQIDGQEVRRAGRNDGQGHILSGNGIEAALNRPVPSPYEQELRSVGDRLSGEFGGLPALGDLVPYR